MKILSNDCIDFLKNEGYSPSNGEWTDIEEKGRCISFPWFWNITQVRNHLHLKKSHIDIVDKYLANGLKPVAGTILDWANWGVPAWVIGGENVGETYFNIVYLDNSDIAFFGLPPKPPKPPKP